LNRYALATVIFLLFFIPIAGATTYYQVENSTTVQSENTTDNTKVGNTYQTIHVITVPENISGLFSIRWIGKFQTAGYFRAYKNGVALGIENIGTSGNTTYIEGFSGQMNITDLIEIKTRESFSGTSYIYNSNLTYDNVSAPTIISPENNSASINTTQNITWSGTSPYQYQISSDSDFSTLLFNATTANNYSGDLAFPTGWNYIRVRGYNEGINETNWSESQVFISDYIDTIGGSGYNWTVNTSTNENTTITPDNHVIQGWWYENGENGSNPFTMTPAQNYNVNITTLNPYEGLYSFYANYSSGLQSGYYSLNNSFTYGTPFSMTTKALDNGSGNNAWMFGETYTPYFSFISINSYNNATNYRYRVNNSGYVVSSVQRVNGWVTLRIDYDGTNSQGYIDGTQIYDAVLPSAPKNMTIGDILAVSPQHIPNVQYDNIRIKPYNIHNGNRTLSNINFSTVDTHYYLDSFSVNFTGTGNVSIYGSTSNDGVTYSGDTLLGENITANTIYHSPAHAKQIVYKVYIQGNETESPEVITIQSYLTSKYPGTFTTLQNRFQTNQSYVFRATEAGEYNQTRDPWIIYENGTYHMWYMSGGHYIWYANSTDGYNWMNKTLVVSNAMRPSVVHNGSKWYLAYGSEFKYAGNGTLENHSHTNNISIVSADNPWGTFANPIVAIESNLTLGGQAWEEDYMGVPSLLWDDSDNLWKLYYSAGVVSVPNFGCCEPETIGVAYAQNITDSNWTRYAGNPIFTPSLYNGSWATYAIEAFRVYKTDLTPNYTAFYHAIGVDSRAREGKTTSTNYSNWTLSLQDLIVDLQNSDSSGIDGYGSEQQYTIGALWLNDTWSIYFNGLNVSMSPDSEEIIRADLVENYTGYNTSLYVRSYGENVSVNEFSQVSMKISDIMNRTVFFYLQEPNTKTSSEGSVYSNEVISQYQNIGKSGLVISDVYLNPWGVNPTNAYAEITANWRTYTNVSYAMIEFNGSNITYSQHSNDNDTYGVLVSNYDTEVPYTFEVYREALNSTRYRVYNSTNDIIADVNVTNFTLPDKVWVADFAEGDATGNNYLYVNSLSEDVASPTVESFTPISPISSTPPQIFTIDFSSPILLDSITWYINGSQVQQDLSVNSGGYTNNSASVGTYLINATGCSSQGCISQEWTWAVTQSPLSVYNTGWQYIMVNDSQTMSDYGLLTGATWIANWNATTQRFESYKVGWPYRQSLNLTKGSGVMAKFSVNKTIEMTMNASYSWNLSEGQNLVGIE